MRGRRSTECSAAREEREEVGCGAEICSRALELRQQVPRSVGWWDFLTVPAPAVWRHRTASQNQAMFVFSTWSWVKYNQAKDVNISVYLLF